MPPWHGGRGFRRDLQHCIRKLALGVVTKEMQMFSRLLYRNKSQHRRDKSFQQLIRVSKDLKRYQSTALSTCVKKILKSFSGPVESMPPATRSQASEMVSKLRDCAIYTARLIKFIEVSFSDVHTRLSMNLFVAFNLVMVASLSRFWFCLRYHLLAIAETYDILRHLTGDLKLPPTMSHHLGKRYRGYLTKHYGSDLAKTSRAGEIARRHALLKGTIEAEMPRNTTVSQSGQSITDGVIPAMETVQQTNQGNDMGVPVSRNEDQLTARERDIALPPKPLPHTKIDSLQTLDLEKKPRRKRPNAVVVYLRGMKLVVRGRKLMSRLESCGNSEVLGVRYTGRGKRYSLQLFPVQRSSLQRWLTLRHMRRRKQVLQRASLGRESVRELQSWFTQELESAQEESGSQDAEDRFVGRREGATLKEERMGCDDIDSIFNALQ